jgi:hypothetical protein
MWLSGVGIGMKRVITQEVKARIPRAHYIQTERQKGEGFYAEVPGIMAIKPVE